MMHSGVNWRRRIESTFATCRPHKSWNPKLFEIEILPAGLRSGALYIVRLQDLGNLQGRELRTIRRVAHDVVAAHLILLVMLEQRRVPHLVDHRLRPGVGPRHIHDAPWPPARLRGSVTV